MRIDLLHRLIRGTASPEERYLLAEWFHHGTSREEFFKMFEKTWDETSGEMPVHVQERVWCRLRARIKGRSHFSLRIALQTVAVAAILILGTVNYRMNQRQTQLATQNFMVSAERGQRAFITLPDSTKVWLNSGTKISYPSDYGVDDRHVSLEGEAYFVVAKHPSKRFIVNAKGMEVEALGTMFNVNSYKEEPTVTVSLFEGSVKVRFKEYMAVLKPHESARVNLLTRSFEKYNDENIGETALWRQNEIAFDGESLEDIVRVMSRLYNVNIRIEDESLRKECYIGRIRNNSLENFLDIINLTTPIVYEHVNDTLYLRRKSSGS